MSISYKEPVKDNTPSGSIYFYKGLGIDPEFHNTIYFASLSDQTTYFNNKKSTDVKYYDPDASGGRTTSLPSYNLKSPFQTAFAIPTDSSELLLYDYMCVIPKSGSKRVYMFISSVEHINEHMCIVKGTIDPIQTFMFDGHLNSQQIERIHSENPTTETAFDEDLMVEEPMPEATEIMQTEIIEGNPLGADPDVCVEPVFLVAASSIYCQDASQDPYFLGYANGGNFIYNSSHSATIANDTKQFDQLVYVRFDSKKDLVDYLSFYVANNDHVNDIEGVYCVPKSCCNKRGYAYDATGAGSATEVHPWAGTLVYPGVGEGELTYEMQITSGIPSWFDGTYRNKKTAHCALLRFSTRAGDIVLFPYKDLHGNSVEVRAIGVCSTNPTQKYYISRYKTVSGSKEYYDKNPASVSIPSFASVSFYNLAARNAYNTKKTARMLEFVVSTFTNVGGALIGGSSPAPSANGAGVSSVQGAPPAFAMPQATNDAGTGLGSTVAGTIPGAIQTFAEFRSAIAPTTFIGKTTSDILWTYRNSNDKLFTGCYLDKMTPTKSQCRAFDDYLSIYGYYLNGKIVALGNSLGVSRAGRPLFTYVKTRNCHITGSVGLFRSQIEEIFNNGIRFWKPSDTYGVGIFNPNALNYNSGIS